MSTVYLNPTGTEQANNWRRGLCPICGSARTNEGCFCRRCNSCSEDWLANTRAEADDGRWSAIEDCPSCKPLFIVCDNPAGSFGDSDPI